MGKEHELEDQDTNIMSRASEVVPQSLRPLESKLVLGEKGEVVLLDDDLETNVYNMEFNKSQQRIVKA